MSFEDHQSIMALKTGPTDRELAVDLRARMEAALNTMIVLMHEAESVGLRINF